MVGTQSLMNIIAGERYKVVPNEIRDYVKGLYGKAPAAIDSEIKQKIIGDQEVLAVRPADLIEPQMPTLRDEINNTLRVKKMSYHMLCLNNKEKIS